MNLKIVFVILVMTAGISLLYSWNSARNPDLVTRISPYIGRPIRFDVWTKIWMQISNSFIFNHPKTPWGNEVTIIRLLTLSGNKRPLANFRIQQLTYISLGFGFSSGWVVLRAAMHKPVSAQLALLIISIGTLGAGWFAVWQLKDRSRSRTENVDSVLPIFLELMAFTVAAGEPMITAMERVTKEISGAFADEVKISTQRIKSGETLTAGL